MIIDNREISKRKPPYMIAELSANHNGSIKNALKTIKAAKECGANAIKIQTYTPKTMTLNSKKKDFKIRKGIWKGRTLYDLYLEAHTPFEWHEELFNYARSLNLTIFSSAFDETAVDLLEDLNTPAYKIASFEITDIPLIKYIAKTKKPILISTGMASLKEIKLAIDTAFENGCKSLGIFHCISSYPTDLNDISLSFIPLLKKKFGVEVGLSDHTLGSMAGTIAVALGSTFIEKHFTLDKKLGGPDIKFSIDPNEMKSFIKDINQSYRSTSGEYLIRPKKEADNTVFRRSLYYSKDIKNGQRIDKENIKRIRPGYGLNPKFYEKILGKTIYQNVKFGDRVKLEHFKKKNRAVLVLSHLLNKRGELNLESRNRVALAYDVYKKEKCDYIITSGWDYLNNSHETLGRIFKKYICINFKIPNKRIIEDSQARDTIGDAIFITYDILIPKNINYLHIVTSDYHVNRTKKIFQYFLPKSINMEIYGARTNIFNNKIIKNKENKSYKLFSKNFESKGMLNKDEILKILNTKHSLYK